MPERGAFSFYSLSINSFTLGLSDSHIDEIEDKSDRFNRK